MGFTYLFWWRTSTRSFLKKSACQVHFLSPLKYLDWLLVLCAKSLQPCPTLCSLTDCILPGSSVHGILQARTPEWVAMPSSRGFPGPGSNFCLLHCQLGSLSLAPPGKPNWPLKCKVKLLSRVRLFVTLWTVSYRAPLSMGFSRQEYWSGLLFPSLGDLSDSGIESRFPT